MEPLSPGYTGIDPKSVYALTDSPGSTDDGNTFTETSPGSGASILPAGYSVSVHRQPATTGITVEVNANGSGFRVNTAAIPQLANGNIADSFAWKATKAGSPDVGPYRVDLEICNAG